MAIEKKRKLSDAIIKEISGMVIRGELNEGDKLPNQTEFAAQLGVSRMSLREALHTLELLGLVKQAPKIGTIICSANPAMWEASSFPSRFDNGSTMKDIAAARAMLENEAARLSYGKEVTEHLNALGKLFDDMNSILEDESDGERLSKFTTLDTQFHMILVEIADNSYLTAFYSQLIGPMNSIIEQGFRMSAGFVTEAVEEHKHIIDALYSGDTGGYVALVEAHNRAFTETVSRFVRLYSRS